jgi:multidrug efflux pump subunit AcrA (membrane-fusion protein)
MTQGLVTIPEVERMQLETSVREADLWRLRVGLAADIGVDAFPSRRWAGRVTSIGTLGKGGLDRSFEEKRFEVSIAIENGGADLRPEMTGRARIVVAERRGVISVPVGAVTRRGDQWLVTVARAWGLEERRVKLGESNGVDVEIVEGLREGERVSLLPAGKAASGG